MLRGIERYFSLAILLIFNLSTGSATGVALLFICFFIMVIIKLAKIKRVSPNLLMMFILFILISAVAIFIVYGQQILLLLDRDPTLTGRTLLWEWGINVGLEKPLLGWGYLGYLGTDTAYNVASTYDEFRNYNVPHFHNSFIQIFANGGILYLAFLLSVIIFTIKFWYAEYLIKDNTVGFAFSTLMILFIIASVFVYIYSRYNDFSTILVMVCIAYRDQSRKVKYKL
jgi:O-antigen ligase